jgi:predicted PurR-regulated permease PerM
MRLEDLATSFARRYADSIIMKSVTIPIPSASVVKKASLKIGIAILLLYLSYVVREIWLPLVLAFLLAMILDPVVDRMEVRGWTRPRASAFIFGSFLIIFIGLIVLSYPLAAAQIDTLQKGFEKYFPDSSHAGLIKSLHKMGLAPNLAGGAVSVIESAKSSLQHSSSIITNYGMVIVSNAIWIVIIPLIAFYALRDFHLILGKGLLLVPPKRRDLVQTAVRETTLVFGNFLKGLAIVSIMNGIATTILLTALRVPGALMVGVIAGFLYSVPYLGAMLTLVLTAAVSFVGGGPNMAIMAVGTSILLHQIVFDQIISPRVLGGHVGLHPILSVVSLLVGNLLLGIVGMILAVPVAACLQIAILAIQPKLSEEIDVSATAPHVVELEKEREKEKEMEKSPEIDALEEMHSRVSTAVAEVDKKS